MKAHVKGVEVVAPILALPLVEVLATIHVKVHVIILQGEKAKV